MEDATMRKTIAVSNLTPNKVNIKIVKDYLKKTITDKNSYIHSLKAELSRGNNTQLREMYNKAEAVKEYAEYLLMAIQTNNSHYLK
jgi:hypothetical protein